MERLSPNSHFFVALLRLASRYLSPWGQSAEGLPYAGLINEQDLSSMSQMLFAWLDQAKKLEVGGITKELTDVQNQLALPI